MRVSGSYIKTAKKAILASLAFVLVIPLIPLNAAPSTPGGITVSGDNTKPTLSWGSAQGELTSGDEWVKRSGRPAGGYIAPWDARVAFDTAVFDGKMWISGGKKDNLSGVPLNDIWYSSDGYNWTEATASAQWAARFGHAMVAHDGKLWVIGGQTAIGAVNDVWYSEDGVTWQLATSSASWSARCYQAVESYNGELWLFAGVASGPQLNDVWRSNNGVDWDLVTVAADWSPRQEPATVVYDGKMWIISGSGQKDVWNTVNGVDWVQVTDSTPWQSNVRHSIAVIDEKIWITSGSYARAAWTSPDGIIWDQVVSDAEWVSDNSKVAVSFNNKLWLVGAAYSGYMPIFKQVWVSSNGVGWDSPEPISSTGQELPYRLRNHRAIEFNEKLLVIAQDTEDNDNHTEVWVSSDGVGWSQIADSVPWTQRSGYTLTVHQGKLWLIGGYDTSYNYLSDVWSSSNGVNWTQETANAPWPGRGDHSALSFDSKLWVMGGQSESTDSYLIDDIWYTEDGENWTQASSNAEWGERGEHASVVFDGKMWVIGGYLGGNWDEMSDMWYSQDGITWTQSVSVSDWASLGDHKVFVLEDKLWLIGEGDVWSSDDGISWMLITGQIDWNNRKFFAPAVFDGRLWAIAGQADGFLNNEVWSTINRNISHYELCWDTVLGGCANTANISPTGELVATNENKSLLDQLTNALWPTASAAEDTISYTLSNTLGPGTWYFSVVAVNYQGEESALAASTTLTVGASATNTPGLPNTGQLEVLRYIILLIVVAGVVYLIKSRKQIRNY